MFEIAGVVHAEELVRKAARGFGECAVMVIVGELWQECR